MLGRFLRTGPWCLLAAGFMSSAWAELPVEQITVASLPPASPYRLYFTDVALPHLPDGRLYVIDGRNLKLEGMVSTGSFAQTTLAPDRSEIYAVITYFSKLNRGERHEEINVFDATTLKLKAEIPYPARHTQALPSIATMRTSADGRFILVQNATPATSIGIVDRRQGKLIAEVPTPGCYGVYPAKSTDRFSTLCGDGTMLTVSHDRDGNPTARKKSGRFFDPDEDALFTSGAQAGDVYHFPTFKGKWQSVNVAGETAARGHATRRAASGQRHRLRHHAPHGSRGQSQESGTGDLGFRCRRQEAAIQGQGPRHQRRRRQPGRATAPVRLRDRASGDHGLRGRTAAEADTVRPGAR